MIVRQDQKRLVETLITILTFHTEHQKKLSFSLKQTTENGAPCALMSSPYLIPQTITLPFTNLNTMVDTIQKLWGQHYNPETKIFKHPEDIKTKANIPNKRKTVSIQYKNNTIIYKTHNLDTGLSISGKNQKGLQPHQKILEDLEKRHNQAVFVNASHLINHIPKGKNVITFDWSKL